jgi:hypothetical protein|tara:strand:+ start:867 stop:968 length:102 start_codon:yes stop_codon:yes gene_type:complete
MTVSEMENKMSLSEFTGWVAYLQEKKKQIDHGR